jgi:hypothetical protein
MNAANATKAKMARSSMMRMARVAIMYTPASITIAVATRSDRGSRRHILGWLGSEARDLCLNGIGFSRVSAESTWTSGECRLPDALDPVADVAVSSTAVSVRGVRFVSEATGEIYAPSGANPWRRSDRVNKPNWQ